MSDTERDYLAELDALDGVPDEAPKPSAQPQSDAPEAGQSNLAMKFASDGTFDALAAGHARALEEQRQAAIDDSQGYSFGSLRKAAHKTLSELEQKLPPGVAKGAAAGLAGMLAPQGKQGLLGPNIGMLKTEEERKAAAQAELYARDKNALSFMGGFDLGLGEKIGGTAAMARGMANALPEDWSGAASDKRAAAARGLMEIPGREIEGAEKLGNEYTVSAWLKRFAKGALESYATRQETALKAAQSMARGEIALPEKAWWRDKVETGAATIANFSTATLIQYMGIADAYLNKTSPIASQWNIDPWDNKITKFGRDLETYVNELFPGDKARQYEFSKLAVQGIGSTITFGLQGKALGSLLGGGPTAINASIALAGAAAQTPEEFGKVTEALKKGKADEVDRLIIFLSNSALGVACP
jgi:hypothetical protein